MIILGISKETRLFSRDRKSFCQNGNTILVNLDKLITDKTKLLPKKVAAKMATQTPKGKLN